jgi:hypothetical protein
MRLIRFDVTFVLGVALLALPAGPAGAADGVLGCGVSNVRLSGGAAGNQLYSVYFFNNFNDVGTIDIERMVVYGGDGSLLCDFPGVDAFPPGFLTSLGPHQREVITSLTMNALGCLPAPGLGGGGGSALIYWSFANRGNRVPLDVVKADYILDLNAGTLNNHMARSSVVCREVKLK